MFFFIIITFPKNIRGILINCAFQSTEFGTISDTRNNSNEQYIVANELAAFLEML